MEIHCRDDILRARGLLLSVDCPQNVPSLHAELALMWLPMSHRCFLFFLTSKLHARCPVCLLCRPRVPFYTLLKHRFFEAGSSLG